MENKRIVEEHKTLVKSSFFSILINYGGFIAAIINSFILARTISQTIWGYLILAISYISIIKLFSTFLPPSLDLAMNYYIPRYLALNQKRKLKIFIKNSFFLKILFSVPLFILTILLFIFFSSIFSFNLGEFTYLLLILSPLIIIYCLESIFTAIYRSLNKFNILFFLTMINIIIYTGGLLYCFLFGIIIYLDGIVFLLMISYILPFIINLVMILKIYINLKSTDEEYESFSDFYRNVIKYGSLASLATISGHLMRELEKQSIGAFLSPAKVTGYVLSLQLQNFSIYLIDATMYPLITSFSTFEAKEDYVNLNILIKLTYKYSSLFLCIMSGFLFFTCNFIILIFLGKSYLIYTDITKLLLISTIFIAHTSSFGAYIRGTNKTKYQPILSLIYLFIKIPLFFFGLIYYELIGAIIFERIIGGIIIFIIDGIFMIKIFNKDPGLKKIFLIFILFFLSLSISIFLENLFLKNFRIYFFNILNLNFFQNIEIFSLILFLILFFVFILIFKMINPKEIELIQNLLNKNTFYFRFLNKFLNIIKKIILKMYN
ncbi:MAG: lipopolysaccharide biosynthesis protein [Promethearchaeia archaeon]